MYDYVTLTRYEALDIATKMIFNDLYKEVNIVTVTENEVEVEIPKIDTILSEIPFKRCDNCEKQNTKYCGHNTDLSCFEEILPF